MNRTYQTVESFLETYHSKHVNYCCSNSGGVRLAHNLIESARDLQFPIVFFALDEESSEYMAEYCDVVNYFNGVSHKLKITENLTSEYSLWSTPAFNALNWPCWEIALDILASGRSIIKLDTDIVIKQNFQNELIDQLQPNQFDFIFQQANQNRLCAGFCAVHPSSYCKLSFIFSEKNLLNYDYFNIADQRILRDMFLQGEIKIKYLDQLLYPTGLNFYENHEKIINICKLIHFNWITNGESAKIEKMKKHNCWFLQ